MYRVSLELDGFVVEKVNELGEFEYFTIEHSLQNALRYAREWMRMDDDKWYSL